MEDSNIASDTKAQNYDAIYFQYFEKIQNRIALNVLELWLISMHFKNCIKLYDSLKQSNLWIK